MEKIAIITGAARGIGKAIALDMALQGFHCALLDINTEDLNNTTQLINQKGLKAESFEVDISNVNQIKKTVERINQKNGTIYALVNNAGILSISNIMDLVEDEWDRIMNVNVKSAVFMTQLALKYMIKQKSGRIINISSLAGRNGGIMTGTAYSVSKAAIIGLTKRTARFAAPYHITVNCIAPGTTSTEMIDSLSQEDLLELKNSIPMGDLTRPEHIAKAVTFLCSESSQSMTGIVLDINGGMYI